MSNLFIAPHVTTVCGMTGGEIVAKSEIIKTMSNDYFVRAGGLELHLTDEYDLSVSDYGVFLGTMTIDGAAIDIMAAKLVGCETLYQADA